MATFINRITICDSLDGVLQGLRGFGGQGRAIDDGNTYFSIFLFPPNRSDKEWQLCTTEGPIHLFSRGLGEGKGH